jgi:hypothetical protein
VPEAEAQSSFLSPTTLGEALDLTENCVLVTEPTFPFPVVHANAAFTKLSSYNFHEVARRPCCFLQVSIASKPCTCLMPNG